MVIAKLDKGSNFVSFGFSASLLVFFEIGELDIELRKRPQKPCIATRKHPIF